MIANISEASVAKLSSFFLVFYTCLINIGIIHVYI